MKFFLLMLSFVFSTTVISQTNMPLEYDETGNLDVTTGIEEKTEVVTDENGKLVNRKKTTTKTNQTTIEYSNQSVIRSKNNAAQTRSASRPISSKDNYSTMRGCASSFNQKFPESLRDFHHENFCTKLSAGAYAKVKAKHGG